jgi:16S rRNA (cytosine1402-N4)-methyltransferase
MPQIKERPATFRKSGCAVPGAEEIAANPRARSARLRAAVRTEAAARTGDFSIFGLPKLPGPKLPGVDQPGER